MTTRGKQMSEQAQAEAFAKYHDERAGYVGVSREFHERAASFLRTRAALLEAQRQEVERLTRERDAVPDHFRPFVEGWLRTNKLAPEEVRHAAFPLGFVWNRIERTERAERERDEARADNAALLAAGRAIDARRHELLDALYSATNDMPDGRNRDAVVAAWAKPGPPAMPEGNHPGAALLREVEALRTFADKVRTMVGDMAHTEDCLADEDDPETEPCTCGKGEMEKALATADKARGPHA